MQPVLPGRDTVLRAPKAPDLGRSTSRGYSPSLYSFSNGMVVFSSDWPGGLRTRRLARAAIYPRQLSVKSVRGRLYPGCRQRSKIFVGDNGTESDLTDFEVFEEHGKGSVYESGIAVAMIIADGNSYLGNGTGVGTGRVVSLGAFRPPW